MLNNSVNELKEESREEAECSLADARVRPSKYDDSFIMHFENGKRIFGECKSCKLRVNMFDSNTTGLKRHLERCHMSKKALKKRKCNSEDGFFEMLTEWMCLKKLPFDFFSDDSTQQFFSGITSFKFPSQYDIKNTVEQRFTQFKQNVLKLLSDTETKISITVDGWTSVKFKRYYRIACHFIDKEWKTKDFAIDFVPSSGCDTGKVIADTIFQYFETGDMLHRILGVTTDMAPASTATLMELEQLYEGTSLQFRAVNQHFTCVGCVLHQTVKKILKHFDSLSFLDDMEEQQEEEEEVKSDSEEKENEPKDNSIPVICDVKKEVVEEEITNEGPYLSPIHKIRLIFKEILRSKNLMIQLQSSCEYNLEHFHEPKLDFEKNLHSTYDMLYAAHEMRRSLNSLTNDTDLQKYSILEDEWKLIIILLDVLFQYKGFTHLLSEQNPPTVSFSATCINNLLDFLDTKISEIEKCDSNSSLREKKLVESLRAGRKELNKYNHTNWVTYATLLLDPRHNLETFDGSNWGKNLKQLSSEKFMEVLKSYSPEEDDNEVDRKPPLKADFSYFLKIFGKPQNRSSLEVELAKYSSLKRETHDCNIFEWWGEHEAEFPIMSKMAKDFLSIQSTSISSEKLFSYSGLVIERKNEDLPFESANTILCMNSWYNSGFSDYLNRKNVDPVGNHGELVASM